MKILLSNDDGIMARGLDICRGLLRESGHEVCVVAPQRQYSGSSHALTLDRPLLPKKMYKNGRFFGFAVNGYPSDVMKLGVGVLYPDVELVVTGINLGNNAGPAVYYSGTVAGAFEGMAVGKPALAFSFDSFDDRKFRGLKGRLMPFWADLLQLARPNTLYNINIPSAPRIKGILCTRLYLGHFKDSYEKRVNPRHSEYYWMNGVDYCAEDDPSHSYLSDLSAIRQGYISVTPLQFDLTDYRQLQLLQRQVPSHLSGC